jgi:hypothetical protein
LAIPDYLGQTEICDLNLTNTTSADSDDEFAFVNLVFVPGLMSFGILAWDKGDRIEKEIFRFDIPPMTSAALVTERKTDWLTDELHRNVHGDILSLLQPG